MKKKKNIFTILISCLSALLAVLIVLVVFDVLKLWIFLTCFSALLVVDVVLVVFLFRLTKKMKLAKINAKTDVKSTGNYMLDIYGILGIEPQYDKDGNLINIYDLLHIKPIYDDNGERVLTVYELLGIVPQINKEGKEIPAYFMIKNRIGSIAKVSLSTAFLTRKLTPEEEEQKLIRETLKQKLDEAQKTGDKSKEKAIKKAIKEKSKPKSKPKASTAPTYKPAGAPGFKRQAVGKSNSVQIPSFGGGNKKSGGDNKKVGAVTGGQKTRVDDQTQTNTSKTEQNVNQKIKETEYILFTFKGDDVGQAPEPGVEV